MRAPLALSPLLLLLALPAAAAPATAAGSPGDERALERLASAPPELRRAALVAATEPDALVRIQLLQAGSSAAFRERIGDLDAREREAIWELAREPGLLEALAAARPTRRELRRIAADHPAVDAGQIREVGSRHHALLVELEAIGADAEERFEALIADLDEPVQDALQELVRDPELLTLLATHVRLSVRLGEEYREDAAAALARLDALAAEIAGRDADEASAWAESLGGDPGARVDLEESARAWADEQGYDYAELTDPEIEELLHVDAQPYPYWYGYPTLHVYHHSAYPWGYWYPRRLHLGYHHHAHHGGLVFFGLPSLAYLDWYRHRWHGHGVRHHAYRRHAHHGDLRRRAHHGRLGRHIAAHPRARHLRPDGRAHRVGARHVGERRQRFEPWRQRARSGPGRHSRLGRDRGSAHAERRQPVARRRGALVQRHDGRVRATGRERAAPRHRDRPSTRRQRGATTRETPARPRAPRASRASGGPRAPQATPRSGRPRAPQAMPRSGRPRAPQAMPRSGRSRAPQAAPRSGGRAQRQMGPRGGSRGRSSMQRGSGSRGRGAMGRGGRAGGGRGRR